MTMSGGALAETFANRRTDYAMVTDDAGRPRELRRLPGVPRPHDRGPRGAGTASCGAGRYAVLIVRDAYQDGRYVFTGSDLAARAASVGLVPKGDLIWYQAGTRLRPYGYPTGFVPNIAHQHLLVLRRGPARAAASARAQPAAGSRPVGRRESSGLAAGRGPSIALSASS